MIGAIDLAGGGAATGQLVARRFIVIEAEMGPAQAALKFRNNPLEPMEAGHIDQVEVIKHRARLQAGIGRLREPEIRFSANAQLLGDHEVTTDLGKSAAQFRSGVRKASAERVDGPVARTIHGRSNTKENIRPSLGASERTAKAGRESNSQDRTNLSCHKKPHNFWNGNHHPSKSGWQPRNT